MATQTALVTVLRDYDGGREMIVSDASVKSAAHRFYVVAVLSILKNLPSVCASSAARMKGKNGRSMASGQMSPYFGQTPTDTTTHAATQTGAASLECQALSK